VPLLLLSVLPLLLPLPQARVVLHCFCAVVVDSGFSFTHVMPVYQGKVIKATAKRLAACERTAYTRSMRGDSLFPVH